MPLQPNVQPRGGGGASTGPGEASLRGGGGRPRGQDVTALRGRCTTVGGGPAQALPRAWGPASLVPFCSYRKINPFHLEENDPHYNRPGKQGTIKAPQPPPSAFTLPPTHAGPHVRGPH